MNETQTSPATPQLLRVSEWAAQAGLTTRQAYDVIDKMPPGIKIRLGRRVRLHAQRLTEYLETGGDLRARVS